jgi:beta-galactosidase
MRILSNGSSAKCLNGYWDFLPVCEGDGGTEPPSSGWLGPKYLVPSFWNKHRQGIRKRGEKYFRLKKGDEVLGNDHEFIFDAFEYPVEWSRTRTAWTRRTLKLPELPAGKRFFLRFDGILGRSTLFVNGRKAADNYEAMLPFETDVTHLLRCGDNEIAVLMRDYGRTEKGRMLQPGGNSITTDSSGIWQDVWLIERPDIRLSDITIRTSTRRKELQLILEFTNSSDRRRTITVKPDVLEWTGTATTERRPPRTRFTNYLEGCAPSQPVATPRNVLFNLSEITITLEPGVSQVIDIRHKWEDAKWWSPDSPSLYLAQVTVEEQGATLETTCERFGFREVWLEGRNIMLNDHPIHMFSDWGHKFSAHDLTEGWIRKWFGMIRDANMNHTRLHTHPHPELILDIADEEGILVTDEAAMHGSGGGLAVELPELWEHARMHIRNLVKRDKNHPSLVLWSAGNEMRWNPDDTNNIKIEMPKLRELLNELDPTRPAYHEGDSSLWNEKEQEIVSRHYGKECSGLGWWDRRQPLHCGEMAVYHYMGPDNTVQIFGDRVWAEYLAVDEGAAVDSARIIEDGRTIGVSCFGPWNLSCLSNLRMEKKRTRLSYKDFNAPGMKPLVARPHALEFTFWKPGKGYTPAPAFAVQANGFRPLAVIDRSHNRGYFAGTVVRRELFVVNDTSSSVSGTLNVSLKCGGRKLARVSCVLAVPRGETASRIIEIPLPNMPGAYAYMVEFVANGKKLDSWTREWHVERRIARRYKSNLLSDTDIAVFGPGFLKEAFAGFGLIVRYVDELSANAIGTAKILVMEKQTVLPGSKQNKEIRDFVRRGGRLILMEQLHSLFPSVRLEGKPVLTAFVRAYKHPVTAGFKDADFSFWGESPYSQLDNDGYVAANMYRKDDCRNMLPLLDSGEGQFGTGDISFTPLFESVDGAGLILACQLRLTEKIQTVPAAERMLIRLLEYAASWKPASARPPVVVDGGDPKHITSAVKTARKGATIVVRNFTAETLPAWAKALHIRLVKKEVEDIYQAVRVKDDPLLNGVSNEDTCGVETWPYSPKTTVNHIVGTLALAPAKGLESLLETPTQSCLKEIDVLDGKLESLRAHTVSRFLFDEKPPRAVMLGRIKVGRGTVIVNQFAPPANVRPRLERLQNRLLANLGVQCDTSLLDGECVPAGSVNSPGYPQATYVFNGVCDTTLKERFIENTVAPGERLEGGPILLLGDWKHTPSKEGVWSAARMDISRDIYLYYTVESPTQRKNVEMNIGIPNPEALTFVDFLGGGTVELIVNSQVHGTFAMREGHGTISDIPLEQGFNRVLVRWSPASPSDTLHMKWRNIMHEPETRLKFLEKTFG